MHVCTPSPTGAGGRAHACRVARGLDLVVRTCVRVLHAGGDGADTWCGIYARVWCMLAQAEACAVGGCHTRQARAHTYQPRHHSWRRGMSLAAGCTPAVPSQWAAVCSSHTEVVALQPDTRMPAISMLSAGMP